MTTKEVTKAKTGLGIKFALEIIEDGKRPMSPDQIKAKYQLDFPFTVKRVVTGIHYTGTCIGNPLRTIGAEITFFGIREEDSHYIYQCGVEDCYTSHGMRPDSERFIYLDGGITK